MANFVLPIWQELTKRSVNPLYPNLPSALRSVAYRDEIPIPVFKELPDVPSENLDVSFEEQGDLNDNDSVPKSSEPILFNQEELSDLIRDLNLSKKSSELLASRLMIETLCNSVQKLLSTEQEMTNFSDFLRNYQILSFVLIFLVSSLN